MSQYIAASGTLMNCWNGTKGAMIQNTITGACTVLLNGSDDSFDVTTIEYGLRLIGAIF